MIKKRPSSQTFASSPKLSNMAPCSGGAQLLMMDHSKEGELKRMEEVIVKMKNKRFGVPIKSVSNIFSKIYGVFNGEDMVNWLTYYYDLSLREAVHFGSLVGSHGYFFPIDDHVLSLKNDKHQLYRFQDPMYWPTIKKHYDNKDYAVYLCKRSLQNKARLELTDHEQENLVKLQKSYEKFWAEIYAHAKAQAKMEATVRDKTQRKLHEGQEGAFWNMLKPVPGSVHVLEIDRKKVEQVDKNYPTSDSHSLRDMRQELEMVQVRLTKHSVKMSTVCANVRNYVTHHQSFEPFLNDHSVLRHQRFKISFDDLLKDPRARKQFQMFLEKEYSAENLSFWLLCKTFKGESLQNMPKMAQEIYQEFIHRSAPYPVNLESKTIFEIEERMQHKIDRYCFEDAQKHIYQLMKRDSYERFIKSQQYQEFVTKVSAEPIAKFHW